jgi:AraC-like DNA-binding protein
MSQIAAERTAPPPSDDCKAREIVAQLARERGLSGREHEVFARTDLERIARVAAREASLLPDLRSLLDRHPGASADMAARHFGISQRTFQRRLRELGTTFQRQLNQAHVRVAKQLMRDTNRPLKWIAIESGYASLQHFSSSFRDQVGMPPSEWRATGEG